MNNSMTKGQQTSLLLGRLERIPFSRWHVNIRLIIGTATFFDAFAAISIAFILPVLIPLWKINMSNVGFLIAISYLGQLIGAIFFGWLSERIGRKKTLFICILLMGLTSLVCALSWSFNSLLIFRLLQGFTLGGEVPIAAVYINEWSQAKGRGFFFLIYEAVFGLGIVGAGLFGFFLIPIYGWQSMFIVAAIPPIFVLFLMKKTPESARWLIDKGRLEEAEKIIGSLEKKLVEDYKITLPPAVKQISTDFKFTKFTELFSTNYRTRTLTVWVLWFCTYFISYGLMTWLPTLFTSTFKVPLQQAFIYSIIFSTIIPVCCIGVGLLVDKVGRKPIIIINLLGLTVTCLLLAFIGVRSAEILFIFSVINGIFLTLSVLMYLYTPELYPTRMRGMGTSVATAWMRIAAMSAPIVVGFIVTNYSLAAVFVVFGAVALIGAIIAFIFAVETKGKTLEEISP